MTGFDASQSLRFSADQVLAIPSILGAARYQVWLISITGSQVSFGDQNNQVITQTRITVADGYRSYVAPDGYLNPIIKTQDTSDLIFSNGQLTNTHLVLGPLVLPYTTYDILTGNPSSGGTDPTIFQPILSPTDTTEQFVWVQGQGLSTNGNFYKVKQIIMGTVNKGRFYITGNMSNMTYRVMLEASSTSPTIPPIGRI